MTCPDCERHKLSASMWRNKAYEASGTPLPWNPEELLLKEYERGRAAGAAAEREACCSGEVLNAANINGGDHPHQVIEKYQAAIRARKDNT